MELILGSLAYMALIADLLALIRSAGESRSRK
jgi:hypothetical protein